MSNCIIVIPIYKTRPCIIEEASFRQCLKILNRHKICIVTHHKLDLSIYKRIAQESSVNLNFKYFDESFFHSVKGYNQLCLNIKFYQSFEEYEYLLIYQLDAWVFKDELDFWCSKGYDYIGAPFFKKNKKENCYTNKIVGIGNGGFSLRKIQYCLNLLRRKDWLPYLRPSYIWEMYYSPLGSKYLILHPIKFVKFTINILGYQNTLKYLKKHRNEDYIFSEYSIHSWSKIKPFIPTNKEASLFAFEINPSLLYLQNKTLPFGCHAFEKYEFNRFWKYHINFE